jgi:hypothetical protein
MAYWPSIGSVTLIAMLMDRTPSSIQTQASRLGLPRRVDSRDAKRRPWTEEDDRALDAAVAELEGPEGSIQIDDVAVAVGRNIEQCMTRLIERHPEGQAVARRIRIRTSAPAPRRRGDPNGRRVREEGAKKCIGCGKMFYSQDMVNLHQCPKCHRGESDQDNFW